MGTKAKRLKVTNGRKKLSQREQLVPGYPHYTGESFCSKLNPDLTKHHFTLKQK